MTTWVDGVRSLLGLSPRGIAPPATPASRRKLRLLLVAMLAFSLACGAVFGKRGWLSVVRYAGERERLEREILELEGQVRSLEEEVAALEKDPLALERVAREELVLGLPGERVIFLDPARRDPRRSPGWISPRAPPPAAPAPGTGEAASP